MTFRTGAGRSSLDFVRTLRLRGRDGETEELPTPAALAAWFAQCGPVPLDKVAPTEAETRQARELREAIAALVEHGTATLPDDTRSILNEAAAQPVPSPRIESDGSTSWHAPEPTRALLAALARDALDLMTSPLAERLRHCGNPDCGAWFVDTSRPGTRRWCSMDTCGSQAKKQTYRAKARVG